MHYFYDGRRDCCRGKVGSARHHHVDQGRVSRSCPPWLPCAHSSSQNTPPANPPARSDTESVVNTNNIITRAQRIHLKQHSLTALIRLRITRHHTSAKRSRQRKPPASRFLGRLKRFVERRKQRQLVGRQVWRTWILGIRTGVRQWVIFLGIRRSRGPIAELSG